jgi:hypothetical protein
MGTSVSPCLAPHVARSGLVAARPHLLRPLLHLAGASRLRLFGDGHVAALRAPRAVAVALPPLPGAYTCPPFRSTEALSEE